MISIILYFIAGLLFGVHETIVWHTENPYAKYGKFFTNDWQDKKFLGMFVPNFIHIGFYTMMLCFIVATYFVVPLIILPILAICFIFGFSITYR